MFQFCHCVTLSPFKLEIVALVMWAIRKEDMMFSVNFKDLLPDPYSPGLGHSSGPPCWAVCASSRHSASAIPQLPSLRRSVFSGARVGSQERDLPSSGSRQMINHCRFSPLFDETSEFPSQSVQRPGDSHQLGDISPRANQQGLVSWDTSKHHSGEGLSNGLPDC